MDTAIGVVGTRKLGQDAMGELIEEEVHESVVVVSRAESEEDAFCKHLGATIGAYMGRQWECRWVLVQQCCWRIPLHGTYLSLALV